MFTSFISRLTRRAATLPLGRAGVGLLLLLPQTAMAVPADPRPKKIRQADGTWITVRMTGDENASMTLADDGRQVVFNPATGCFETAAETGMPVSARRKAIKRGAGQQRIKINNFPTTGSQRSLVLLVEFSDTKFTSVSDPKDYYTRMLNEEGFTWSNGANGSARDFYISSSAGLFAPEFVVVGPITLPQTADYYGSDAPQRDAKVAEALRDACLAADADVDFSRFDSDGDGYVDNIFYFYAGHGQADNPTAVNTIWPHSANLEDAGIALTLDGVKINNYACSNELAFDGSDVPTPTGIGTFVHEFGHVLGLADHYDAYDSRTFTVGPWDTMSTGSYNNGGHTPPLFSAFERAELGWLAYDELSAATDTVSLIPYLGDSNRAYRIGVPGNANEYYILENRQQRGWDEYLPGHGMLVWHIDMDEEAWLKNEVNIQTGHQRVDIVAADDKRNDKTRDADPFPGTAAVTQATLSSWAGDALLSFDCIAEQGGVVKFALADAACRVPQPAGITVTNLADSTFTVAWTDVPAAAIYELTIAELDGKDGRTPVEGFDKLTVSESAPIAVKGLKPLTSYEISVTARMGSYSSAATVKTVQTTEIPFGKLRPEVSGASGVTAEGFTASWTAVRDADNYALTLCRYAESAEPVGQGYDFADKADGLPALWSSTSSTYYSVPDWYGAAAPSLYMSADGAYLEVAYPESTITELSFWCRSRNADGTIYVDEYRDGEWTVAATLTPPTEGQRLSATLSGCEKVRIRYARESGYVVIDDVVASCITMQRTPVAGYDGLTAGNVLSYTFAGLAPATTYSLRVTALSGSLRSLDSEEYLVTTASDGSGIAGIETSPATSPDAIYDLSGRRLKGNSTTRGIYIIRGKKVVR